MTMQKAKIGFWLETPHQQACEIAALVGFDLVIFDMEHGALDDRALDHLIPFCTGIGMATYVRVADSTRPLIQAALDLGADGVIVPQIRDLNHARETAHLAKYPPQGSRGLGYGRPQRYAAATDAFIAEENRARHCYLMIETAGALAEVDDIAKLPCVDGLFIGPADLSLVRGRGVFDADAEDLADMQKIAAAAARHGKLWAAAAGNKLYREAALSAGPAFVTSADDLSALKAGFTQLLG
jgi:4-hydroxy-2-oxoheptanedioate aldolase